MFHLNRHYDGVRGGVLYNRYIDELVRCGHLPPLERPEEFAPVVAGFLA